MRGSLRSNVRGGFALDSFFVTIAGGTERQRAALALIIYRALDSACPRLEVLPVAMVLVSPRVVQLIGDVRIDPQPEGD